jgi:hypothetical protein
MDSAGAPLFPPAFKHGLEAPSCGPFRLPTPVPSGHSVKAALYAIVRANDIRATADVIIGGLDTRIEGRPVTLQVTDPDRPRVSLHTSPSVFADLTPAATPHGPLTVIQWWACRGRPGGFALAGSVAWYWQTFSGSRLAPLFDQACGAQREWHAIAGWLNQSVARINYVRASP